MKHTSVETLREARKVDTVFNSKRSSDDEALARILSTISELGLNQNLMELEHYGFTIVRGVLSEDRIARAKAGIFRRVERASNGALTAEAASAENFRGMEYMHYLLFDDPVFQEILLEPKPLALITYLLGESCVLSSMGSHARGPGGLPLAVHADGGGPAPFPDYATVANCNYALTPYSQEAGALMLYPGSHRHRRPPMPEENWRSGDRTIAEIAGLGLRPEELDQLEWVPPPGGVTMNIDPGDAVVWHGATWHGGWRREIPGVRMNLSAFFCRQRMATQERRDPADHPEVFERWKDEPRFGRLLGRESFYGWREEGLDEAKAALTARGRFD